MKIRTYPGRRAGPQPVVFCSPIVFRPLADAAYAPFRFAPAYPVPAPNQYRAKPKAMVWLEEKERHRHNPGPGRRFALGHTNQLFVGVYLVAPTTEMRPTHYIFSCRKRLLKTYPSEKHSSQWFRPTGTSAVCTHAGSTGQRR